MKAHGFSLLESLLVMVLISLALLALLAGQRTIAEHTNLLMQRNEALQLAENTLEQLRNISSVQQADGSFSATTVSTNTQYLRKWQIQNCLPANLNCKSVDVAVEWTDQAGEAQSVSLSSRLGPLDLANEYKLIKGS